MVRKSLRSETQKQLILDLPSLAYQSTRDDRSTHHSGRLFLTSALIDGFRHLDYTFCTLMNRRTRVFDLTLRCLLSVWLGFGCLELAEQFNLVPEVSAEDQAEQDLDRDALSQLASGLKSDVPSLGARGSVSVLSAVTESISAISLNTIHQLKPPLLHDPPSLPLHQQLSVYRI